MAYIISRRDPVNMETKEIFAEFDGFTALAVEVVERYSALLVELRKRREPHPFFRHTVLAFFQSIADGQLAPEAAIVLGNQAMIVTLVIAAAPYVARMVESSIKEVDAGVIEAAQAMGTSSFKIVYKVLIPEAKPSLIIGSVISMVTILGYSAMAGTIGGGGLGKIAITYGYQRYYNDIIWICVILTILIVQIIQEVGTRIAHKTDKRIS